MYILIKNILRLSDTFTKYYGAVVTSCDNVQKIPKYFIGYMSIELASLARKSRILPLHYGTFYVSGLTFVDNSFKPLMLIKST